jgi:hypothetical protein
VHTSLPHQPWHYLPDGRQYTAPTAPGLDEGQWVGPQWLADQSWQRHLVQTQFADTLFGRLVDRLRAADLYDRALIVVAADHGVSFRAGDRRRRPTPTNVHDVANLPLLIKTPGQRSGRVVDSAVRTIDVLPTIARELGLRLRDPIDGVPASERDADPATEIDVPDSWELGTTTTFGEFLRQREERRRYERTLLRAAGDDPYRLGPRPELVGIPPVGLPTARFRLADPAAFDDLDPSGAVVPAFVAGTVRGVPEGGELAIAVNGRIEATTRVDGRRFGALVAPRALRGGRNRIAVYDITDARI